VNDVIRSIASANTVTHMLLLQWCKLHESD